MTRMLSLAALALACAASPALAMAASPAGEQFLSPVQGLLIGTASLAGLIALAILAFYSAKPIARALSAIACVAVLIFITGPALAAEVVAPVPVAPAVILPWGDWIVAIGQTLTSVLLPVLVALLGKAVYQIAPWARLFLTQARLEQMTKAITDYALNATEGVVKGQALTIPVGSAVIAKAVQRAVDAAPAKVVAAAGGPNGVAELVFRTLHLQDGATAANTLAPAQAAIVAK